MTDAFTWDGKPLSELTHEELLIIAETALRHVPAGFVRAGLDVKKIGRKTEDLGRPTELGEPGK